MAIHPLWSDEYWLLVMQLFLKKPVGVKPLYSKALVELSLELHIPPQVLYEQMFRLRRSETPHIQMLWEKYGKNPKKLSKDVNMLRRMAGFGSAAAFYEGVEMNESFERDFKPIAGYETVKGYADGASKWHKDRYAPLTPVMLIMILDLYFRLTPITMVEETPEIAELARLMKTSPATVVEVMDVFKFCDPYLNRADLLISPLLVPCQETWNRFGNDNPEKLSSLAAQLKEYFK